MTIVHHDTKEEWLAWRKAHLTDFFGASEASTCAGINPYKTEVDLYMERMGLKPVEDISEKERVRYGTDAEDPIRRLFALDYADRFNLTNAPWDICLDDHYPFIGATLDGSLEYTANDPWTLESPTGYTGTIHKGDMGVYEGKTALIRSRSELVGWQEKCPDWYLAQGCQQLYVTRRKFWFVNALVELPRYRKTDDGFEQFQFNEQSIVRHVYFMDDPIVRESIKFVIGKVVEMKRRVDMRLMPEKKLS